MRPSEKFKPFARLVAAIVFLPALLASSGMVESHKGGKDGAHSHEVGALMEALDADFGALVKAVLVTSVQELVSETPYATIQKHAKAIAATAKILPGAEEFRGDSSMLAFSRRLEGAAAGLVKAAGSKKIDDAARALLGVHAACVRCHEEARF